MSGYYLIIVRNDICGYKLEGGIVNYKQHFRKEYISNKDGSGS